MARRPPISALRWRLKRCARRQIPHSLFLIFASLLIALTLVVDLIGDSWLSRPWIVVALIAFCIACAITAFVLGSRIPNWIGLTVVAVFIAAECWLLGLRDDPRSVVAAVQQLPILSLYLGWFVAPRVAVPLISACLLLFGGVMLANPLFAPGGFIGAPVVAHGLLTMLVCFIAGSYLWRWKVRLATTDPLTGALNRFGLERELSALLEHADEAERSLGVIVLDFDDFKHLNDSRGHAAGDAALIESVRSWRAAIRRRDLIARTGGDEFVIVLPRTDASGTESAAMRLRVGTPYAWSWGSAQWLVGETAEALLSRADAALYAQKRRRGGPHV